MFCKFVSGVVMQSIPNPQSPASSKAYSRAVPIVGSRGERFYKMENMYLENVVAEM
jgi:hypothetical protein